MNDEKMNLDDVIAKTMDALTATGLQYGSLQCYWKFFVQSKKFSYEVHGTRMYDPAVIGQYLQWKKENMTAEKTTVECIHRPVVP